MKKLVLVAIVFFGLNLNAQDVKGVIKINPIGLLYSANITYEKPINESGSAMIRFRYYHQRLHYNVNDVEKFAMPVGTMDFKFGYRFYLSKKHEAPRGFYVSPTANIMLKAEETDSYYSFTEKSTIFGAGVHAGKQWIWGKFAFDLYGGLDVLFHTDKVIMPVGGLSIGFVH